MVSRGVDIRSEEELLEARKIRGGHMTFWANPYPDRLCESLEIAITWPQGNVRDFTFERVYIRTRHHPVVMRRARPESATGASDALATARVAVQSGMAGERREARSTLERAFRYAWTAKVEAMATAPKTTGKKKSEADAPKRAKKAPGVKAPAGGGKGVAEGSSTSSPKTPKDKSKGQQKEAKSEKPVDESKGKTKGEKKTASTGTNKKAEKGQPGKKRRLAVRSPGADEAELNEDAPGAKRILTARAHADNDIPATRTVTVCRPRLSGSEHPDAVEVQAMPSRRGGPRLNFFMDSYPLRPVLSLLVAIFVCNYVLLAMTNDDSSEHGRSRPASPKPRTLFAEDDPARQHGCTMVSM